MFSDTVAQGILNHITGNSVLSPVSNAYLALFNTAPTADSGIGSVEVTGAGYGRVLTTGSWNMASGSGPSFIQTSAQVSFNPAGVGGWGTIVAFGLYSAITGGNFLMWDWLGNYTWQPVTISAASPAVFTTGAAAYPVNTTVVLDTGNRFGGVSPIYTAGTPTTNTVLTVGTPSGFTFQLQNVSTLIGTSAAGSSMIRQMVQQQVPQGVQPNFASGSLVLTAA